MRYGKGRLQALSSSSLRRLHRGAIDTPDAIRDLLEGLQKDGTVLANGVDWRSAPRRARVAWVGSDRVGLHAENIECGDQPQIYLQFEFDGSRYFFAAPPLCGGGSLPLEIALPLAIYEVERRDLHRESVRSGPGSPSSVQLEVPGHDPEPAEVRDWSYQGLGVATPKDPFALLGSSGIVRFLDGERAGERHRVQLRHRRQDSRQGWVRLGLAVSQVTHGSISVESRKTILDENFRARTWRRIGLVGAMALGGSRRAARRVVRARNRQSPPIEVVQYRNDRGQEMRAIVDSTGERRGASAVVIAPAWGRTKETLAPLAATLISSFEQAGEPLVVLRFDGTNRRGESHVDPECRTPGQEYLHFTFTQAVRDIEASFDYLERDPQFRPSKMLLVTYSLGAVEGRRAVARDGGRRLAGWISVVGMVDLQSGLRSVSGGVDYAFGLTRGVSFGRHELVGVTTNMDHTGLDALASKLVFAEDAFRDMAQIEVPITWIHGRHDAWMDLERVQMLLSAGDPSKRRLIEVPTGHQMRSSREAFETFQLAAGECLRMLRGLEAKPALPNLAQLERKVAAERARLPKPEFDLRSFWGDYLLGRDRRLGIELMTATTAYRELMALQIARLDLEEGAHVVDLGAGTGDFPVRLGARRGRPSLLRITEVDYVPEALRRGAQRLGREQGRNGILLRSLTADLDLTPDRHLPLRSGCADAVLASLLISYIEHPERLLEAVFQLLRPQGRLVLSTLRRDADISKIYKEGISELPPDRVLALFGAEAAREFDSLQRDFLNDASRLLDMEEAGRFRFWDEAELRDLVRQAGFEGVETEPCFGEPAQAWVLSARRP